MLEFILGLFIGYIITTLLDIYGETKAYSRGYKEGWEDGKQQYKRE